MGGSGSGRPKSPPSAKKLLKEIFPAKDLFNEEELDIYNTLVDIYIKDFDEDDLSSADLDDIISLSMNRVLEIRLLKTSKDKPDRQIDISTSIEKLRKQTEKIKESLSLRRRDRLDPNEFKGLSIVDLAVAFDNIKKHAMEDRARKLKLEQGIALEQLTKTPGNRYDVDDIKKAEANNDDY